MLEPGALPTEEDARLVPADWTRKWLRIRRACGWGSDALASYAETPGAKHLLAISDFVAAQVRKIS